MGLENPGKEQKPEMNRRKFLTGALAVTAGAIPLVAELGRDPDQERIDALRARDSKEKPITFLTMEKHPRSYDTKRLEGMKFGPPLSDYFGTKDKLGAQTPIDFKYQLAQMWKHKLDNTKVPDEFGRRVYLETIESIVTSYHPEKAQQTDLAGYGEEIDAAIQTANQGLNWNKLRSHFKFGNRQAELFERWLQAADSETFTATSMAELLPAGSAARNAAIFETLLQTGGSEFLSHIPSAGDTLVSRGQYQFTKHVVFEDGTETPGSASYMDRFGEKRMLPPNVLSLQGRDQHIAAYLLAAYNLALLVRAIPEDRAGKLLPHAAGLQDDVRTYLMAAHHRSRDAREAFGRFASGFLTAKEHNGASPRYATFTSGPIAEYVEKGQANLSALRVCLAEPIKKAALR